MPQERFWIEAPANKHDRSVFSYGQEDLDRYFREQSGQNLRRKLTAVFVLHDTEHHTVAGFYTLSVCEIEPFQLAPALAKRLPRRRLPATLLGRLAVDLRHRGRGFGRVLLADALIRAGEASRLVASMAIVVDAKDDTAANVYEHFGFARFEDARNRLYLPMTNIRAPSLEG